MKIRNIETDAIMPPGDDLAEEMEARGMTPADLAERMERPENEVLRVLAGEGPLTAEFALGLDRVLGASAKMWLGLEADYRLALARRKLAQPA